MKPLEVETLCKSFGPKQVLRDVSFSADAGKLVGFLGPNGAGKTTAIRILLGLLRADSGRCQLLGKDCWREGPRVRADVGYLPGEVRLYESLTGASTLDFFAAARGADCRTEIARLRDALQLDLKPSVRAYSSGMKQKLGLIQALMHRPQILVLDEPTNALDPLIRQVLFDELRQRAADGAAVLFSSHTLSEVDELCDEVVILRDGQVVESSTVAALRERALRRVVIRMADDGPTTPPPAPEGLQNASWDDDRLTGQWIGPMAALIEWLHVQRVADVTISPPDLEDLFMAYYNAGGNGSR